VLRLDLLHLLRIGLFAAAAALARAFCWPAVTLTEPHRLPVPPEWGCLRRTSLHPFLGCSAPGVTLAGWLAEHWLPSGRQSQLSPDLSGPCLTWLIRSCAVG